MASSKNAPKNSKTTRVTRVVFEFCLLLCVQTAMAQTGPSELSPKYFGPNAFPVPDMVKCTAGKLQIEVGATGALGWLTPATDKTVSADFSIRVPLWTDRVNFCFWGQAYEWYWDNPQTRAARGVSPEEPLSGNLLGDYYFSVDALILRETEKRPAITLRAACKTAMGGQYARARFYDVPGYFFDACIAKDFKVGEKVSLGVAASAGFMCWQVRVAGNQDDAFMYGLALGLKSKPVNFSADWGGYIGWRNNGDKPMTLKLRADFIPDYFVSPFIAYQRGFMDWPFDQFKLGVRFSVKILREN